MPIYKNWPDLYVGSSYGPHRITILDFNKDPIDTTGWESFCQIRKDENSDLILDMQPSGLDGSTGTFVIDLTAEQTADLTPTKGARADFVIKDSTGRVFNPVISGYINIQRSITRTT